jgi:hypothetical protein
MRAAEVAKGIKSREDQDEDIAYRVCDPSMFKEDGGPSIAEVMGDHDVFWKPADNSRIAGWEQMRNRFSGEDGRPMIYAFDTCVDSIRTIPSLQHSAIRPEDLDTDGEDHAADEWRYGCMSRPWAAAVPVARKPRPRDLWDEEDRSEDSWKVA